MNFFCIALQNNRIPEKRQIDGENKQSQMRIEKYYLTTRNSHLISPRM